ncbi:MAG TPA: GNAT family N-acetyltransferase [Terriglobia bacterium]|nr:GNAT family N-acetyltransferase [Terriglobia bacterium]
MATQGVTLRPVRAGDEPFLYEVFASTRTEEMALTNWTPAQQDAFLRRQFLAQHEYYAAQFPQADHHIILTDGRPMGRLLVSRNSEAIELVDISLLPQHRASGIGTRLIKALLDEGQSAGKPVRLYVFRFNRAQRLYERLGFYKIGETPTHIQMEAIPDTLRA